MRLHYLSIWLGALLLSMPLFAQTNYVLTTSSPSTVLDTCGRHGLTVVATGWTNGVSGVYLVSSPTNVDPATIEYGDPTIANFEANQPVAMPELSGATAAQLSQSVTPILESLSTRFPIFYFGSIVPSNYLIQPAIRIVRLHEMRFATGLTGSGLTIAVIDTGVDPKHPALSSVLTTGFDFTRNQPGVPSELADLAPALQPGLTQSVTPILESQTVVPVNNSTLAILDQSVTPILEGTLPQAFGHGTMTAGLAHLVAPRARIMPLKAFHADGTSDVFSIIQAIYYAADHGANVISMSFEVGQPSNALIAAIKYAQNKNVILVASAGNDSSGASVFPAGANRVFGIGSTTNSDVASTFSNFGSPDVLFAAPGEGVITTYPGGNYAAGWGTSFSAPMVAGSVALALQSNSGASACGVANALARAVPVPLMGKGRVDFYQALTQRIPSGGCDTAFSFGSTVDDD
ncbi:MAG: hypothetical protein DMG65_14675 [Candidatus Angelobacter sp. Gp1-AA117]|nr:MAG: hypothetical protein DMG65_14675 [Candidatus Angelobacter sp. Gp1-AA117]